MGRVPLMVDDLLSLLEVDEDNSAHAGKGVYIDYIEDLTVGSAGGLLDPRLRRELSRNHDRSHMYG